MADIVINGTSYPLKFGMKFLRDVNKRESVPVDGMPGVEQHVGVRWMIAEIMDRSIEALADAIFTANRTETPRLDLSTIDEFLADENTDIEQVFEDVLSFFEKANVTAKTFQDVKKAVDIQKKLMEKRIAEMESPATT